MTSVSKNEYNDKLNDIANKYNQVFKHFQAYRRILRQIQADSGIIEAYGAIIRHIRNYSLPLHIKPCYIHYIQISGSFRT